MISLQETHYTDTLAHASRVLEDLGLFCAYKGKRQRGVSLSLNVNEFEWQIRY